MKLSKVWQALVPHAWEYRASCHVPPLAVAGRWGSIDGSAAAHVGCEYSEVINNYQQR